MQISIAQLKAASVALTLLVVVAIGLWKLNQPVALPNPEFSMTETAPVITQFLIVDVQGKVRNPGVYELPAGSRVIDAIEAAGGLLRVANPGVNQARFLQDGELIEVGVRNSNDESGKINLNSATATQLESLPGIGPVLASRIVADRESNGPFQNVKDLDRVSGVGQHVLSGIDDLVVCE